MTILVMVGISTSSCPPHLILFLPFIKQPNILFLPKHKSPTQSQSTTHKQTIPSKLQKPSSFPPSKSNPPPNSHTPIHPQPSEMASAMYRPAFSRSTSSSNASISSQLSASSSSVRAFYTRDGQGFDFTDTYPPPALEAESLVAAQRPAFTRAVYAKDARGVSGLTASYKFSKQQTSTSSSRTPFTRAAYSKDGRGVGIDFYASYKGRQ